MAAPGMQTQHRADDNRRTTTQAATEMDILEADDRGPPPYSCGTFALRLLVPQLWLVVWVVFLWLACYSTQQGESTVTSGVVQVTVGPSCVMPPPPPPARESEIDACDVGLPSKPPGPLGPEIRTTSPVGYKHALAPEKTQDISFGEAPAPRPLAPHRGAAACVAAAFR